MTTPNTNQPDNVIGIEKFLNKLAADTGFYKDTDFRELHPVFIAAIEHRVAQEANKADGCPCLLIEPCSYACSCASPNMSGGCGRCCKYGSKEQRLNSAQSIADKIKQFNNGGE